jgi:hypothetical protein
MKRTLFSFSLIDIIPWSAATGTIEVSAATAPISQKEIGMNDRRTGDKIR